MPAPIIGAAIVGAGAVAGAAVLSGGANKAAKTAANAQQAQIEAQQRAAAEEKATRENLASEYPTYLSLPESQKYKQTLEDRMAGRGLIDVNAETSPIAGQLRAGLKEQTMPAINANASARGLGRSTIPVNQAARESAATERDIAERMSSLELARQEQIGQAVGQYGQLTRDEQSSQAGKTNLEAGTASQERENQFNISDTIANKGATEAAYQLRQAEIWSGAIQGLSKSAAATTEELIGAIDSKQSGNKAMVNTGRTTNSFNSSRIGSGMGGFLNDTFG